MSHRETHMKSSVSLAWFTLVLLSRTVHSQSPSIASSEESSLNSTSTTASNTSNSSPIAIIGTQTTPVPLYVPLYNVDQDLTASFLSTKEDSENPTTAWRVFNENHTITLDEGSNGAQYTGHVPVLQNDGQISCKFSNLGDNAICVIQTQTNSLPSNTSPVLGSSTQTNDSEEEGSDFEALTVGDEGLKATAIVTAYPIGYDSRLIPANTTVGQDQEVNVKNSEGRLIEKGSFKWMMMVLITFGIGLL